MREQYLSLIRAQGFVAIAVQVEKPISVPDDVLAKYLDETEIEALKARGAAILSITVYGEKPRT